MGGLIVLIFVGVLAVFAWGHGVKWTSDQWGRSDSALVGAVLLGLAFVPVFVIIGAVTEGRRTLEALRERTAA